MKKTRYMIMVGTVSFMLCLLTISGWAQQSVEVINYQGNLSDTNGPMNGFQMITFAIFDTEIPGSSDLPLWSETHSSIQISEGIFNVRLGSLTHFPVSLFDTYDDLYLRITVGTETLTPLQQLASVPYAMKADTANHAHTATAADSVLNGTVTGDLLVGGSVGVGTSTPESLMHLSSMGGIDLIIEADTNNSGGEDQNARVVLRQDGGQVSGRLGYRHEENDLEVMQAFDDDLIFGTNDLDRMTIKNDGKIGIGTAEPEAKLHIVMPRGALPPSTVGGLVIEDNLYNSGNQVEIQDEAGNARVVVDGAGRVGIGTDDPHGGLELKAKELSSPMGYFYINNHEGAAGIRFNSNDSISHSIYDDYSHTLHIVPSSEIGGIFLNQAGNVGIGEAFPETALDVNGRTKTDVLEITGGSDLSERFDIRANSSDLLPTPGMVVSIDPESPGILMISKSSYDKKVAGIISGAGGINPGMVMGQENSEADGANPVALTGRVYCRANVSNGTINPGDLLTTSHTPGHAMKVNDYKKAQGAIIGKAMTGLEQGQGLVLVLVTLQ